VRPGLEHVFFLPERSYLPPGTLREVVLRTGREVVPDGEIRGVLERLGLGAALERSGGLDAEHDWNDALSLGEQQLLSIARAVLSAPRFVFLDRVRASVEPEQYEAILRLLTARSITYLTLGNEGDALDDYDAVLHLASDGSWTWERIEARPKGAASEG
jgi:putative ATP-binding cassette transporter